MIFDAVRPPLSGPKLVAALPYPRSPNESSSWPNVFGSVIAVMPRLGKESKEAARRRNNERRIAAEYQLYIQKRIEIRRNDWRRADKIQVPDISQNHYSDQ